MKIFRVGSAENVGFVHYSMANRESIFSEWTVIVDPSDRLPENGYDKITAFEEDVGVEEMDSEDVPLEKLTIPQLKEMLRAKGLPVSGKKADLIERLQ